MMTFAQQKALVFIEGYIRDHHGISPSFAEIADGLGLRSKAGVHRLVRALEERRKIRVLPYRARAIEVIPSAEIVALVPPAPPPDVAFSVPLMGTISAGVPIRSIQTKLTMINVPGILIQSPGAHFALTIRGEPMLDAGIHDGDTAIFRQGEADNGAIVCAEIDEAEATIARLRRRGAAVALEYANLAYETRIYARERIRIRGHLVGLIRRYEPSP